MRTLQQIFDVVIAKSPTVESCCSFFMCNELECAAREGTITVEEMMKAKQSIRTWLRVIGCNTVSGKIHQYLVNMQLEYSHYAGRARVIGVVDIYSNWRERPRPSRGSFDAVFTRKVHSYYALAKREARENDQP